VAVVPPGGGLQVIQKGGGSESIAESATGKIQVCPNCHAEMPVGIKFCTNCGHQFHK